MQKKGDKGVENSKFSYLVKLRLKKAGLLKRIKPLNSDGLWREDKVLNRNKPSYLIIGGAGAELKLLI